MSSLRFTILIVVALACCAPVAWAQELGVDGAGGGGKLVPGADEDGDSLSKVFQDGVDYLAEGDCKRAEEKFERVLKKVPRNSETNYLRGIALQCLRRYEASIRYFRRAKRDDIDFFPAYGGLGISYLALDRPDRARRELDELTKYKKMCERGNLRCPPELLKAHKKLETAIKRAEGAVRDPKEPERHGRRRDSSSGGRRHARVDTPSPLAEDDGSGSQREAAFALPAT